MEEMFMEEEDNFRNAIIEREREIQGLEYIIEKFVPKEEKERIEKCLDFSANEGCYKINKKKALMNNYKNNIDKIKEMKRIKIKNKIIPSINDDPIHLQLEKPETFCVQFTGEENKEIFESVKND